MVYTSYLSTHCTLIYLCGSPRGLGEKGNIGKISKGTREHEPIFREQGSITVQIRRRKHFDIRNKYMLFTGWEVRIGRNCARGLEYGLGRYSDRDLKVSGKFSCTLQPMCVEVGRVRVDEARDRLQTKTKHYNMIFSSVSYIMALTALFWNRERFLCLDRQFII